jgi:hypothetical protein
MTRLAVARRRNDIFSMKKRSIAACLVAAMLVGLGTASAQVMIPPGASPYSPQPPLPGPKIQVPVVPKLDELPSYNYLPTPRPSFSDKITTCLQEGAAAGLGPGDREAYSRSCANSR